MDRPHRESRYHNGITLRGLSQLGFATKSARSGRRYELAHDACPWDLWRVSYRARLTLFAMVYALANGVPAAGVAFAAAMLLGVALTLGVVALLTIFAREWCVRSWTRMAHP
jgi:hypothetical protein